VDKELSGNDQIPEVAVSESEQSASRLAALLTELGLTIATAESCTGGLIAAALTSVAGSSAFFNTGIVSYSNSTKRRLLGVPAACLAADGAVSESVVLAMANGASARDNAEVAIAVSGIAGPAGGSEDKPVGTVWIAWVTPRDGRKQIDAERFHFEGDRNQIRNAAVVAALHGTIARLRPLNESGIRNLTT